MTSCCFLVFHLWRAVHILLDNFPSPLLFKTPLFFRGGIFFCPTLWSQRKKRHQKEWMSRIERIKKGKNKTRKRSVSKNLKGHRTGSDRPSHTRLAHNHLFKASLCGCVHIYIYGLKTRKNRTCSPRLNVAVRTRCETKFNEGFLLKREEK